MHSLVDSGDASKPGGTGKTFDWRAGTVVGFGRLRRNIASRRRWWADTRECRLRRSRFFKPWGVDVVSGVEARPGKKDPEKVRAFVRAVREMDRKTGLGMATVPRTAKVKIPTLSRKRRETRMGHPRFK